MIVFVAPASPAVQPPRGDARLAAMIASRSEHPVSAAAGSSAVVVTVIVAPIAVCAANRHAATATVPASGRLQRRNRAPMPPLYFVTGSCQPRRPCVPLAGKGLLWDHEGPSRNQSTPVSPTALGRCLGFPRVPRFVGLRDLGRVRARRKPRCVDRIRAAG